MKPATTTICILDDHKLFSGGLELLLKSVPGKVRFRIFDDPGALSGELDNGLVPDLFVLDYYIPGCNGADLIGELRSRLPGSRILVVSASIVPADRRQAVAAGADLFLNKNTEPGILLNAVISLLAGKNPKPVEPESALLSRKFQLTPRQLEILVLTSKGLSNKEIARLLGISPETIKSHLHEVFQRFGVSNRMEAITFARSQGLS